MQLVCFTVFMPLLEVFLSISSSYFGDHPHHFGHLVIFPLIAHILCEAALGVLQAGSPPSVDSFHLHQTVKMKNHSGSLGFPTGRHSQWLR